MKPALYLLRGIIAVPPLLCIVFGATLLRDHVLAPRIGIDTAPWPAAIGAWLVAAALARVALGGVASPFRGASALMGCFWAGTVVLTDAVLALLILDLPSERVLDAYRLAAGNPWPWIVVGVGLLPWLTEGDSP